MTTTHSNPPPSLKPQGTPPSRPQSAIDWLGAAILIITVLVLAGWQLDRSYWNDEAWGVDSATQPNLLRVWQVTIEKQQPGPPGFLALLHLAEQVRFLGPWVFRAPAILSGLLLVFCAAALVRQMSSFKSMGLLAGLVLLANPFVQRYLTESKQYMTDGALTVALIVATRAWITAGSSRAMIAWTLLATLGVTLSFAFWFTVAATGPMLFFYWLKRRNRQQLLRVAIAGLLTAISASIVYFTYAKPIASGMGQLGIWDGSYLAHDGRFFGQLWDFWSQFLGGSWIPYSLPGPMILAAAMVGLGLWIRREPITGIAVIATLLVTIAANLVRQWPMVVRVNMTIIVLLHLACMAIPLCLAGWLADRMRKQHSVNNSPHRFLPFIDNLGVFAALLLASATLYMSRSFEHEPCNIHALMRETAARAGSGDQVILDWATRVHQELFHVPMQAKVVHFDWTDGDTVATDYGPMLRAHRGRTFILSSMDNHDRQGVWNILAKSLAEQGSLERIWSDQSRRVAVAIYEFKPK